MYNLTSLQLLQAHLKLLNASALMLVYVQKRSTSSSKDDSIELSLNRGGIWKWLQQNTSPSQFADLRLKACLDNELFLFDVDIPIDILTLDVGSNWRSTYLSSGDVIYPPNT